MSWSFEQYRTFYERDFYCLDILVGTEIELCVIDDGVGFDISKMEEQSDGRQHIGVRNARIRFQKMCNGTVDIYSEKGKGTKIRINLPKGGQS